MAKSITIEIRRVENGYEATLNKGGRWNPIPLGRRRYVGDLDEVLELATKRVKEVFKE
ncbi:hypothetical protein KEJ19_08445 [Candidatus Bathyarchaeota archaeon]|nr:hypothetical protein [Candidatus Bathyarchaeota archaeon]